MKFVPPVPLLAAVAAAAVLVTGATSCTAFFVGPSSTVVPLSVTSTRRVLPRASTTTSLRMVADNAKVCVVTGSSRGLGKAVALELGRAGQKVVVNYVSDSSQEAAAATVQEIKDVGGDAVAIQADSSNPATIKILMDGAVEHFGTIDVLINNAGITRDTLVLRMKPEQWQAVIDINLSGVFYCTQAFFKVASKKRTGRIVNISSVVGQIGNPGQANYAAAKGGVIGMTYANAKEFAARGITVNAICPGYIESDMTKVLDQQYLDKVSELIPLKRLGKPEEVAGMARFLAIDPAADYITGHCFNVDGGIAIGV